MCFASNIQQKKK
jgi:hypothetical protein